MRIVVLNETFTRNVGYAENLFPRALARLGDEVHLVAANLQVYHNHPDYKTMYEPFNGPAVVPPGTEQLDGFTLHRLPHRLVFGHAQFRGLRRLLKQLRPEIVQTFAVSSWDAVQAALIKPFVGYSLFTGAHQTASVFPQHLLDARFSVRLAGSVVRRALPGFVVSLAAEKCFAATEDCGDIAVRFYGVPKSSVVLSPLGVDTDLFRPAATQEEVAGARRVRQRCGVGEGELLCVYTGRFTSEKNPLCLARAVAHLRGDGRPFSALFLGSGVQRAEIGTLPGCSVHPFVPWQELPVFYRAADVGVWPTQESVSMLDAAASGVPIVVSDRLQARERVDGNGLTYREGDHLDLARTLRRLEDPCLRQGLGRAGARKMSEQFSWAAVAAARRQVYLEARAR